MAWGKCDDGFYDHPKVRAIKLEVRNAACGLFWRAISLCNRTLSDGRITDYDLPTLDATDEQVSELVRVKLWQRAGRGWRVHDFFEFNESRETILERREKLAEAGRLGGLASGRKRRSKPPSKSEAEASRLVRSDREAKAKPRGLNTRSRSRSTSASNEAAAPQPPDVSTDQADDHLDAWYRLTASWPSDKVAPWLNQLADQFGSGELSKALGAEAVADSNRATLISRTQTRLERSAHYAAKEADQRAREKEVARLREIETMPIEKRRENQKRLSEMMAAAGIGKPAEGSGR